MLGLPRRRSRRLALLLLALFWVAAGVNHFRDPAFYLAIMPPWLPAHAELVWLSGIAEVAGGLAVLVPRLRAAAGWGLVALLIAIFPANIHMALHPEQYGDIPRLALYARLPVQFILMWWAWWATRPNPDSRDEDDDVRTDRHDAQHTRRP